MKIEESKTVQNFSLQNIDDSFDISKEEENLSKKRQELLLLSIEHNGDYFLIKKNLFLGNIPKMNLKYEQIIKIIGTRFVTIYDKNYPFYLKHIEQPPWVLYYLGDINIFNNFFIFSVIGKRNYSPIGYIRTNFIVSKLKNTYKKPVIVSGCANGIDRFAHESAMNLNLKTVGVLGFGFNYLYPRQNKYLINKIKKEHLLLTEYPYFVGIKKHQFKARNRIIAGLSKSVFIIEAGPQSGTLNTAFHAFNNDRDIFCFYDHSDEKSGCNYLIEHDYAKEILI
ncbi:DNA-processing protein DprA [Mycoplasma sp. SG1]|uniref:DNA-processing protein DprA n=1 Tax=Mycoplasma sp. SG1 TaxID=2810348 RepID=UPI002023F87A|nr:DNA-processing protein DprA [Mycoplasma sp. SG1]URM52776.1 DNA-protecting protein DprA [Mycoplasma sp. SG1]